MNLFVLLLFVFIFIYCFMIFKKKIDTVCNLLKEYETRFNTIESNINDLEIRISDIEYD